MDAASLLEAIGTGALTRALEQIGRIDTQLTALTVKADDFERRLITITARVTLTLNRMGEVMATLADLSGLADELRKDVARLIAEFQAAQTTIPAEAQAQIDLIAGKLGLTDADVEAASPEPTTP